MNSIHVNWAKKHDWFVLASKGRSCLYKIRVKDDMNEGKELVFTDFKELCDWAGY